MSNSSLVVYTKISPNKTSPRSKQIDTITIHHMAGNLSLETCGNIFAKKEKQASSNYGVSSDGKVGMYCEEKDRSWCSCSGSNDNRAVTIEVANDGGSSTGWHVSDKAINTLVDLCVDICKRNGISKLVWSNNKSDRVNHKNGCNMTIHSDFYSTSCPGPYLTSKLPEIASRVSAKLAEDSKPIDTTGAEKFVDNLYINALGRPADADGKKNWVNSLVSGKSTGSQVAQGIVMSAECQNRNLNNDAYVDMLYLAVLGRPADAVGKSDWVSKLNSGTSRDTVFYAFVSSTEFSNYCKSCGIVAGSVSAPTTTKAAPTTTKAATTDIKVGDKVKINSTCRYYYDGKVIPSWIKKYTWIVSSISNDRVVLNKSVEGNYYINSPINKSYLTKV